MTINNLPGAIWPILFGAIYAAQQRGEPIPPEIAASTSEAAHHWLIGWWKRYYAEQGYPVWETERA